MDELELSTSGTLNLTIHKKKTLCKWKVNVKPKTKKEFNLKAYVHLNGQKMNVNVDVTMNEDKTSDLTGTMTTKQGKKTVTVPIDIKNYKPGKTLPMLM